MSGNLEERALRETARRMRLPPEVLDNPKHRLVVSGTQLYAHVRINLAWNDLVAAVKATLYKALL